MMVALRFELPPWADGPHETLDGKTPNEVH